VTTHPRKAVPADARQHRTAGPYSPVVEVDAQRLVVLSGQVAVDLDGAVVGTTIEEQAAATLDNCRRQLAVAGVGFADVFKVNVYLTDLAAWSRFNAVYEAAFPHPLPARTAIQAILMPGFQVEIEMWAVKP
jgi:2-iminobutanoate/2-iminopropanoate deaminase